MSSVSSTPPSHLLFHLLSNRTVLLSAISRTTQLTADTVLIHESLSDSELAAATHNKKPSSPKRSETFGGFDRRPSQKTIRRATTTIPEGKLEENTVAQRRDSGLSLASKECFFIFVFNAQFFVWRIRCCRHASRWYLHLTWKIYPIAKKIHGKHIFDTSLHVQRRWKQQV